MKSLPLMLIFMMSIATITSSKILAADSDNYSLTKPMVGVDANRDGKISIEGIMDGQDTFIVREAKPTDLRTKGSFTGIDGKTYIPLISLEQLRALDLNKDGIITNEEMQVSKIKLMTARILAGTSKVIIERPIWESLMSIQFPGKAGGAITAKVNDQDALSLGEIK